MMSNLVPFGYSFQSERLPAPRIHPLPTGQSQMVSIICTPESYEFLLETIRAWFAGEKWSHVILVAHGACIKQEGNAFFVLEWEEAYIDDFFLRILEIDESVIDFAVYIRDGEV